MDSQWEDHPYLPNVSKPVFILGNKYDSLKDRTEIANYLRSRLWMTYRKGFSPIGGNSNGPKSDAGWGCMHRCSQMILAETMLRVHLGLSWQWTPNPDNAIYQKVLQMFQDRKSALYSIQTITLTGVAIGKSIGSWFGPNTAAQVIKKLSVYDRWTNLHVHISVEDGIIMDEIKFLCRQNRPKINYLNSESKLEDSQLFQTGVSDVPVEPYLNDLNLSADWNQEAIEMHKLSFDNELIDLKAQLQLPVTRDLDDDCIEIVYPPKFESTTNNNKNTISPSVTVSNVATTDVHHQIDESDLVQADATPLVESGATAKKDGTTWRPLLLFVSLRLGLQSTNVCYFDAIKAVFQIPYCIGILGGRPSHAVWIVGQVDENVLCLDPHFTQPAGRCSFPASARDDAQFHCTEPIRLPLACLDPSIVLGFLCQTEFEFDQLCDWLRSDLFLFDTKPGGQRYPLVEVHSTRPTNMPPLPLQTNSNVDDEIRNQNWSYVVQSDREDDVDGDDGDDDGGGDGDDVSGGSDKTRAVNGKLNNAVGAMVNLWFKCNQVAGDKIKNLISHQSSTSNVEFDISDG